MLPDLLNALTAVLNLPILRQQHPPVHAFQDPPWTGSEEGAALMKALEAPIFEEFHEHLQLVGIHGNCINRNDLANWCVGRAGMVGAQQATEELATYIALKELDVFEILLLASVHIDAEFEFSNGVRLARIESIPNSRLSQSIQTSDHSSPLPLPSVSSVMIAAFKQPRFHYPNLAHAKIDRPWPTIPIDKLRDTQRALALARFRHFGIHSIANGTVIPDYYPFVYPIGAWSVHSITSPPLAPSVIELEMHRADEILTRFELLNETLKAKLRISIDRFNGYASGADVVDRAIDLRICLESVFLDDGTKEQLRYTLALRAARYLGSNFEERASISSKIKKGYDLTSSIVHTGKIGPKDDLRLLDTAAELARRAILKLIDDGRVDWKGVELGNT